MACCVAIAALLAVLLRPLLARRPGALAWRPGTPGAVNPSWLASRARSLAHAFAGLAFLVRSEPHMRIHLFAAGCAAIAGSALRIDIAEWRWLILATGLVIAAEALNTGVEQACNAVSRDYRAEIKAAKDVSAAAVLVAAMVAGLIGVSVLGPRLLELMAPRVMVSALICGGPA